MYDILRPLLFQLDAEKAHHLTLYALGVAQRVLVPWTGKDRT